MKKRILLFTVIMMFLATSNSFSQVRFGVKAGMNLANMSFSNSDESVNMIASFHVGPIVEYNVSNDFYVESGILLSGKGCKSDVNYSQTVMGITETVTGYSKVTPLYIEIPINALYKVDLNGATLHVFAGPYLGFGIGGSTSSSTTMTMTGADPVTQSASSNIVYGSTDSSTMKMFDFGLNFGVGLEYNNMLFKVQYGLGLTNLSPTGDSSNSSKNNVIGISVGYMFGEGSKKHHRRH